MASSQHPNPSVDDFNAEKWTALTSWLSQEMSKKVRLSDDELTIRPLESRSTTPIITPSGSSTFLPDIRPTTSTDSNPPDTRPTTSASYSSSSSGSRASTPQSVCSDELFYYRPRLNFDRNRIEFPGSNPSRQPRTFAELSRTITTRQETSPPTISQLCPPPSLPPPTPAPQGPLPPIPSTPVSASASTSTLTPASLISSSYSRKATSSVPQTPPTRQPTLISIPSIASLRSLSTPSTPALTNAGSITSSPETSVRSLYPSSLSGPGTLAFLNSPPIKPSSISPVKMWMKKGKHLLHRHSIHPRHAVITGRNFDTLNEDRLREWLEEETCGKVKQVVLLTNEHNVYPEWHALVVKACEVAPILEISKKRRITVPGIGLLTLEWDDEPELPLAPEGEPRPRRKSLPKRIYDKSLRSIRSC